MRILLAPDKFKDALNAEEVCSAFKEGILLANPNAKVCIAPLADGGEGTLELLVKSSSGQFNDCEVLDPLFRPIKVLYGISKDGRTAFIEMAKASGLQLLNASERNCMNTSSIGTGQLILDAIQKGCKHIILTIGGSATNDAGMGMAHALGYRFYDSAGEALIPIGKNLINVCRIANNEVLKSISDVTFQVACDVHNPLFGENGAAFVYAAQKGASGNEILILDQGLKNIAKQIAQSLKKEIAYVPGSGAAGGMGGGAIAFLNATLHPGIDLVIEHTRFEELVQKTDFIFTGEGKIDKQTLSGKVIQGIAKIAQKYQKPVFAFGGTVELSLDEILQSGLQYVCSISHKPQSLPEAILSTRENLIKTAYNLISLMMNIQKK